MIKISKTVLRDLDGINQEHYDALQDDIIARLEASFLSKTISRCQHDFIFDEVERILKGKPDELVEVNKEYKAYCNQHRCKNITKGLKGIFNYKRFSNKHTKPYCAFDLAAKLDVRVCPYCNRQYTFTVVTTGQNISRPEFDHFFSQEKHPLLALSFYNLVPSCKICNSTLKHKKQFSLDKFVHPYAHGFESSVKFNYHAKDSRSAIGLGTNMEITVTVDDSHALAEQFNNNVQVFKLKEVYQGHRDIVAELVRKFYMTDGRYLETLFRSFPQIGGYEELYRLAFGNYFNIADMDQRILAKLTKDIVGHLDFILPVSSGTEDENA